DLPCQLIPVQNPGIADVEIWRNREDAANDGNSILGNSILEVHDTLSITSNINNVVERSGNRVTCFRISDGNVAHDERDRTDRSEIETANIEIAAEEISLIVGNPSAAESLHKRAKETDGEYVPSFVHRLKITVVQGRTKVVHSSAQKP